MSETTGADATPTRAALERLLLVVARAYHGRADAAEVYAAVREAEELTGIRTGIEPLIGQPEQEIEA